MKCASWDSFLGLPAGYRVSPFVQGFSLDLRTRIRTEKTR